MPGVCYYSTEILTFLGPLGYLEVHFPTNSFYVGSDLLVDFIAVVFFAIPQLIFIGQLWRYYRGAATRRKVILLGIIGLVPFAFCIVLVYVMSPPHVPPLVFPLPMALLIGLIVLRRFPLQRTTDPEDTGSSPSPE